MLGPEIQGVLIPGSLTIPSTWQLLKISSVMNSFLIHRQSHHRRFKVPRCPQHSKYLFWNVSQRLHLIIALALLLEQTCQQIWTWFSQANFMPLMSLTHSTGSLSLGNRLFLRKCTSFLNYFFCILWKLRWLSLTRCDSAGLWLPQRRKPGSWKLQSE